jgi:ketosteroid isomerase-like protein
MRRFTLALAIFASSTALADLADQVRCREIGFSISAETRNAESFASFIDSDARFVGNSVTHGPVAIAEAWGAFFADNGPFIKWRPQFVEVLEDESLALTRGPYRMISKDENGDETEHWGTFNSVWRLQADGDWNVVFDAGSDSAEPPADEVKALLDQENDC